MTSPIPSIPISQLSQRQQKLAELLPKSSLVILPANTTLIRNSDIEIPFRQESMFWYFTGINEPNACLIVYKNMAGVTEFTLYLEDINTDVELWNGKRLRVEEASQICGLNQVYYYSNALHKLSHLLNKTRSIWVTEGSSSLHVIHTFFQESIANTKKNSPEIKQVLSNMRMYKSDWEIQQLTYSAELNIKAHKATQLALHKNTIQHEYQLQAELEYIWRKSGCTYSYPPIVAAGNNATTLHYINNNMPINVGDLVLIDAGCEYNYYASDITRTWKTSNTETGSELVLNVVVEAHKQALKTAHQSGCTIVDIHRAATISLINGMIELGILKGSTKSILNSGEYAQYWPHSTSHWLGLDTHDFGVYKNASSEYIQLENGLVFTVEPGLYIPSYAHVPSQFQGVGVRIEDNVAITEKGVLVLTKNLALV